MSEPLSRRHALKKLLLVFGAAEALHRPGQAAAAELPHLTPDDPTAAALGYVNDATKVDPKQNPTYQAGQVCHTCLQLQGTDGQPWRPCTIFPGKLVNANGWCRTWIKKG
jgi:hypothetical protein